MDLNNQIKYAGKALMVYVKNLQDKFVLTGNYVYAGVYSKSLSSIFQKIGWIDKPDSKSS